MKAHRYYEIVDGVAYVYDQPYREQAVGMSIVKPSNLAYYRSNFQLEKVWNGRAKESV